MAYMSTVARGQSNPSTVDGRKMFKFNGGNVERTIYGTVFLQLTEWVDGLLCIFAEQKGRTIIITFNRAPSP